MNVARPAYVLGVLALSLVVSASACSSDPAATTDGGAEASVPTDSAPPDSATPDSTAPDSAVPDSAVPDSAIPDATPDATNITCSAVDAGAQCNTVVNGATDVVLTAVATATPTGTGGTPADGRYYLTNISSYAGSPVPAGLTTRQTLELCGGATTGQLVNDQAGTTRRKTFTFTRTGAAFTLTEVCKSFAGDTEIPYASFTATPTTLTFYSTALGFSATYTKQ